MYRPIIGDHAGLHHGFADGGMGMYHMGHVIHGAFQLHRGNRLGNHIGSLCGYDMNTHNLAILGFTQYLDKTVGLALNHGFAVNRQWKLSNFVFNILIQQFILSHPDRGDFGISIHINRKFAEIKRFFDIIHVIDRRQTHSRGDLRKKLSGAISGGIDIGMGSLHKFVHSQMTLLQFQFQTFHFGQIPRCDDGR